MFFAKKEYIFNENIKTVRVIGAPGCASCKALFENTQKALSELGASVKADYISDIEEAKKYNVLSVPVFLANDKVISAGRSFSVNRIKDILCDKKRF